MTSQRSIQPGQQGARKIPFYHFHVQSQSDPAMAYSVTIRVWGQTWKQLTFECSCPAFEKLSRDRVRDAVGRMGYGVACKHCGAAILYIIQVVRSYRVVMQTRAMAGDPPADSRMIERPLFSLVPAWITRMFERGGTPSSSKDSGPVPPTSPLSSEQVRKIGLLQRKKELIEAAKI